jgi:hypothetical protein
VPGNKTIRDILKTLGDIPKTLRDIPKTLRDIPKTLGTSVPAKFSLTYFVFSPIL